MVPTRSEMSVVRRSVVPAVVLLAAVANLMACGGGGSGDVALSPEAQAGREIANGNACAACHGSNGQGGSGPAFVGLFGTTVPLADGSTVLADEDYLVESIKYPDVRQNARYRAVMPTNQLTDGEVEQVVTWIRELGPPDATETP